jgi:flagellar hook-associated protein 1 FlgK
MSLLDSLNIGMRGLHAAQTSIDVTGQNISNANTEGYSRKRVNQEADSIADGVLGQKGLGVDVISIGRVRNEFLDKQIWEQLGDKGMFTQLDSAMTRLENILQEPTPDGLAANLDKFFGTWQDLANNPSDLSAREAVKSSATTLADVFHNVFNQIEDFGLSMNNPLSEKAKEVNSMTSQIYQLNEKIAGVESMPGQKANDTRDQRDLLIRKLSELVDVQTVEDKQGRAIITSGGNLLVGPSESMKLETYGVDKTLSDGTQVSELRLRFSSSLRSFEPRGGELRGIMDVRSDVLSRYMEDLNSLAKTVVEQVNAMHVTGYNLNQNTGVYFFDPTKTKANSITLSDTILGDSANIAAAAGGKITDVAAFAPAGGIPAAGSPTLDLKTINPAYRNLVQGAVQLTLAGGSLLTEGAGKDYVIDYDKGVITFLNYTRFNPADVVNVKIAFNTTGFPGNGNGQNALLIAQLRQKATMSPDAAGNPTQSISAFYSAVVGKLGIEKNQNKSSLDTKDFLVTQMDNEQSSVSGVSLDEEMANMIKYQNSYQASAKFIGTVKQMLDILMNI